MVGLAKRIHVTEFDQRRLLGLLKMLRQRLGLGHRFFEAKLTRAIVLPQAWIPPDVVTMNSKVLIRDLTTRDLRPLKLAFPGAPDSETPHVSVLDPFGMALLGAREKEEIWVPECDSTSRWLIEHIAYQPEAAGNFAH